MNLSINSLAEAKRDAAKMFINFSEIMKKCVLDNDGKYLGNVLDVSVKLGEVYPKAEELITFRGMFKKIYASIPWSSVSVIEDNIVLNLKSENIKFEPSVKNHDFLLRRDILDQQVVDTFNHKVRRVNDVHLLKLDNDLVIAHVDIGLRGLIRRLGWERWADLVVKRFARSSKYLKKEDLVSWKYVQPISVNPASMTVKLAFSEKQLQAIPAADLGDIIFDLNRSQRIALFRALDIKTKAKVFENLEFGEQKVILKELDKREAAQIVANMSSDEATDLLEKLPRNTVKALFALIESTRAKKLSTLLGYSSDSAGGFMTTEFVSMPETISVESAIDYIKNNTKGYDTVPYIYIVDEKNHLKGVTTIRRLLFADPKELITKTAFQKTLYIFLNNSVTEIAYFMDKYKISAIPVIDESKVLHGIVTIDDVLSKVISIAWRKRSRIPKGI